ncbi:hypothetical protein [Christensenella timonensis]|uniref:hypothetical protein n=1 Tax=Christensenella timonensis TaxID=1816678 RepID=UPI00082CCAD0|nr:hypothetical protein [Christensenella timonensis]
MNGRKKILAVAVCAALCVGLAGCTLIESAVGIAEGTKKLLTPKSDEKEYIYDENLKVLGLDEFYIYEDGKPVLTTEEMGNQDFSPADPYSEYYGERFEGQPYDLRGHAFGTKHGIGIGSTMEEMVEAYDGYAFAWRRKEPGGIDTFDLSIEQIAEMVKEAPTDEIVGFYTEIFITKDGQKLTTAGFMNYLENDIHVNGQYVVNHMDEYFEQAWSLYIAVENGIVVGWSIGNEM